jgi:hypothetical protein
MKVDGRKLSHSQLEAIRFAAVQAGAPPTAVAREMGLYTNRVFVWLAAWAQLSPRLSRARLQCFPADLNLGDSQRVSHGRVCSH